MSHLTKTYTVRWLNLDSWSEAYVGAHWLVKNELPEEHWQSAPHHGPLSQMVLIASHHLVEIILFASINTLLKNAPDQYLENERQIKNASFQDLLTKWPSKLQLSEFDLSVEPYKSVKRLQTRRNATIHKESALTTLPMARSALYSAVEASRAISQHMLGPSGFKYDAVLRKYPLCPQSWFSDVSFPE